MPVNKTQAQKSVGRKSAVENDLYPNAMREATLIKATTRETTKTVVTIPSTRKSAADLIKFNGTSAVGIVLKRFLDNSLMSNFTIHDCVICTQT